MKGEINYVSKIINKTTRNTDAKYEVLDKSFYKDITGLIYESRRRIYSNIDSELVMTNWKLGMMIDEKQKSLPRADYGEKLIQELSIQLTKDFGIGYSKRNLEMMRKFYRTYQIPQTASAQLSWSHYSTLLMVKNDEARQFF